MNPILALLLCLVSFFLGLATVYFAPAQRQWAEMLELQEKLKRKVHNQRAQLRQVNKAIQRWKYLVAKKQGQAGIIKFAPEKDIAEFYRGKHQ